MKSPEEITQTTLGMNLQSSDLCVRNNNVEPTNQPMRKGSTHTIHKSAEENHVGKNQENLVRGKQFDPVRNEQTMEVLREEKQLRFCLWMNKQQEGHENWKCVSLQHSRGAQKMSV